MPSLELVVAGFLAVALAASIISSKAKAPYTLVLVFFGLIIASSSLSTLLNVNFLYDRLIGGGLFVGLVLPPLLFETTMSIRYEEFRSVARPALRLATIGVVIATLAGGLFLWLIAQLPFPTSFVFAAIISPTDTATVLEIFRRAHLPRKLTTLMETEAVFNDATGITIFTIITTSLGVTTLNLYAAATTFLTIFDRTPASKDSFRPNEPDNDNHHNRLRLLHGRHRPRRIRTSSRRGRRSILRQQRHEDLGPTNN